MTKLTVSTAVMNATKKKPPKEAKKTWKEIYEEVHKWLFDGDINSELDNECLKSTTFQPKYWLHMFAKVPTLCIFMNKHFNNYYFTSMEKIEICKMCKQIVIANRFTKWDLFNMWKQYAPNIAKIKKHEPYLKVGEVKLMHDIIMNNPDNYIDVIESYGLTAAEDKKVTKIDETTFNNTVNLDNIDNVIKDGKITDELILIDTQSDGKQMYLIMLNTKTNKKQIILKDPTYWYYTAETNEMSIEMSKCKRHDFSNYWEAKNHTDYYKTFEKDVSIESLHTREYYDTHKESETLYKLSIMFYDIEVQSDVFPDPELADYPVSAITWIIDDKIKTYVLVNDKCQSKKKFETEVIWCLTEKDLLSRFLTDIYNEDPFVLSGWNSDGFDWPYVYNRVMKKYPQLKSLIFKYSDIQDKHKKYKHVGFIHMDLMDLYKMYTFNVMESYSLNFIATAELKMGKLQLDQEIHDVYNNDIDAFIDYNIRDTLLLKGLNKKLRHIELTNEIRKIARNSWNNCMTTLGFIDGLIIQKLHSIGLVAQTANRDYRKEGDMEGAYVRDPKNGGGVFTWVVDFDAASLYPSIIQSFNMGVNTYLFKFKHIEDCMLFIFEKDIFYQKEFVDVIVKPHTLHKEQRVPIGKFKETIEKNQAVVNPYGTVFKGHDVEKSWYSDILDWLAASRKHYKNLMFECIKNKDAEGEDLNNIRQIVYKVAMNSIYGLISSEHFRCATQDIGASVTCAGRHLIKFVAVKTDELLKK